MLLQDVAKKYIEFSNDESFRNYEKRFAEAILKGLCDVSLSEPRKVRKMVEETNNLKEGNHQFSIRTNSIFIHGNKLIAEFICCSNKARRELGDLIFIITVLYNGGLVYQKTTITQCKNNKQGKNNKQCANNKQATSWEIDEGQLYLLSRFPKFKITCKGDQRSFCLQNYSNNLGTYALFYDSDFFFLNAPYLELIRKGKKSINMGDISELLLDLESGRGVCSILESHIPSEYSYNKNVYYRKTPNVFGLCDFALNIYDFASKYLRCCIGEVNYSKLNKYGRYNKSVSELLYFIIVRCPSISREDSYKELLSYLSKCLSLSSISNISDIGNDNSHFGADENYDDNGFGIIHTVVNLGEENS